MTSLFSNLYMLCLIIGLQLFLPNVTIGADISHSNSKLIYESIGRNGVNVLVYTPHTDSASLWKISQLYRNEGATMVSFFDAKINGTVDDYLLSDHWWAHYIYNKSTLKGELSLTGYGRNEWSDIPKQKSKKKLGTNIELIRPESALWVNVKIYELYKKEAIYMGEIICIKGNNIKILTPDGIEASLSKKITLNKSYNLFVDKNDPAIKLKKSQVCE